MSVRSRKRFAWWGLLAAELLVVLAMLGDLAFPVPLPDGRGAGAIVLARDGTPLRAFADHDGVWRYPASSPVDFVLARSTRACGLPSAVSHAAANPAAPGRLRSR